VAGLEGRVEVWGRWAVVAALLPGEVAALLPGEAAG